MGIFKNLFEKTNKSDEKQPRCAACGKLVNHVSVKAGDKTLNGVRCKNCGKMYCLACKNPTKQLLKCDSCGSNQFSFIVDGE